MNVTVSQVKGGANIKPKVYHSSDATNTLINTSGLWSCNIRLMFHVMYNKLLLYCIFFYCHNHAVIMFSHV